MRHQKNAGFFGKAHRRVHVIRMHRRRAHYLLNGALKQTCLPKEGAICVQRFDGSQSSAIHTTYRISLRSSSMREPRDPLLKVCLIIIVKILICFFWLIQIHERVWLNTRVRAPKRPPPDIHYCFNDPSAGSPTETLLRLLLPLNDQV